MSDARPSPARPSPEVPRPRKISAFRRARRFATYLFIRVFVAGLHAAPLGFARWFARRVALAVHALVARERRRALEHVALAFPDLDVNTRARIVREAFAQLGDAAAEIAHVDALRKRFDEVVRFDAASRSAIEGALAEGRGVIVVAGHIGNWELLGFYLASRGYPVWTLARAQADPRLDGWVRRFRESRGVHTILRHEAGAAKAMLRAFRDGAILGFFLDQDTDVAGVFVPFFGRDAWTPSGAAVMALRTGAAVVVATMHREADHRHALRIERAHYDASGPRDDAVLRFTAELTARLESAIRREPAQWVWMHQRWKRRPPDEARAA